MWEECDTATQGCTVTSDCLCVEVSWTSCVAADIWLCMGRLTWAKKDHCGMNALQTSSANGDKKEATTHARLLYLNVFSHPVHEKVRERGVLHEVFLHNCDIVLSWCRVLVATVSPCYEVCLGDRKSRGFWWCMNNGGACNNAQSTLSSAGTQHSPGAVLPWRELGFLLLAAAPLSRLPQGISS